VGEVIRCSEYTKEEPLLKKMIRRMLIKRISMSFIIILFCVTIINMNKYVEDLEETTYTLFDQIEQILSINTLEKNAVISEYKQLCMNYADTVAYILNGNSDVMNDADELKKLAGLMQIDEIHIFDENGAIIKGTRPEYYGMTVYDGEQIGFFAQMLKNKSLRLCQELTPNTADGTQMQYAAVWSDDGRYIIQIGITPDRLYDVIEKNQLSHIFSLLTTEKGIELYAVDIETGEVLGSTLEKHVGKCICEFGMEHDRIKGEDDAFFDTVFNERNYCILSRLDSIVLLRTTDIGRLYGELPADLITVLICLVIAAIFMVISIEYFLNKTIVQSINEINEKITAITLGDTEQVVDVYSTPEFELLSTYINYMKKTILKSMDKMSYVLDHASLPMGVYEYNANHGSVRVTNQVRSILGINGENAHTLLSDFRSFETYIGSIKANSVRDYENTYSFEKGSETCYVRIEYFEQDKEVMGIVVDVTDNVLRRRQIERERDYDKLTGLYNRRALEARLDELFANPKELKYSAIVMLDSDGLKQINDKYEHKAGDNYICEIARILEKLEAPHSIVSRQGGDEFVIFFYGCESHEELMKCIIQLYKIRDNMEVPIYGDDVVTVKYSFGYSLCHGRRENYSEMFREADVKMYEDKRMRKGLKEER